MPKEEKDLVATLAEAFKQAQSEVSEVNQNKANSAALEINRKINEKSLKQTQYASRITKEMQAGIHCVDIAVPKVYYEYQPSFVITINGVTIKIPADGKTRRIHNDFAVILMKRMHALDDKIERMRGGLDNREIYH